MDWHYHLFFILSLSVSLSASCVFLPISVFPFMQQLLFCHCFYALCGWLLIPFPTLLIHSVLPLSFSRLCMINVCVDGSCRVYLSVCLTVWGCVAAIWNECSRDGGTGGCHTECLGYGWVLTGWLGLAMLISPIARRESLSWDGKGDWFIL